MSFALYASRFGPGNRWLASDFDPADYRFVAEYFWSVPTSRVTYRSIYNSGWGEYLRTVPFRGIGLGTLYLPVAWIRIGHVPVTEEEVIAAGIVVATVEKAALAIALITLFAVVRKRWGTPLAFAALLVTAFPPHYWRMCDDFIAEPVERIVFLLALACAVAMAGPGAVVAWAAALTGLLWYAALLKVQWSLAAMLLLPAVAGRVRASGASLQTTLAIAALIVSIPLSVLAVNWIGWRTARLNAGVGLHVNLKYEGAVLLGFGQSVTGGARRPPFADPRRPKVRWWNIYVGGDVRREDYQALDAYALRYIRKHWRASLRSFGQGIILASSIPAVQRVERGYIRMRPLAAPWAPIVRVMDAVTWLLLLLGLRFRGTRLPCALALVLWVIPALGNVFSLYELRYHIPMAGTAAVAAAMVAMHLYRTLIRHRVAINDRHRYLIAQSKPALT